ncbi:hypothetical protein [Streptomyces albipurpureus]|nr:hypothetical protein [Streptomyces sp. CWNU-1]
MIVFGAADDRLGFGVAIGEAVDAGVAERRGERRDHVIELVLLHL